MNEQEPNSFLDQAVRVVARAMDALGLNGSRLLWRWNNRKRQFHEGGVEREMLLRSAKAKHKMCPACRALIPRNEKTCSECGESLSSVATPGVGRVLANALPGATAANSLILLVNGFWFVLMLMAQLRSGTGGGSLFSSFDIELLVRFGAGLSQPRLLSDGLLTGGEWWRIVTPIFLHGSLLHFFFNSYVLIQLGPIVEEIWGTPRFWVIYLTCGLAGSAASQVPRFVITVGASGAIMGLMGLLLVYGWRHGGLLGQSLKQAMLRFGAYMLVMSILFHGIIDHFNHAGGLVCGALLALLVPDTRSRGAGETPMWRVAAVAGVILVLYAFLRVALHLT